MKYLVIVLFVCIHGQVSAQEYKDTIYVNTDRTTIIHVVGNASFVNSIEIPKSTLDAKNLKGKLIYYKADDLDDNGTRIYRLKAIRPFNETIYGTIISDDGLSLIIKYSDTITKSFYKVSLKSPVVKIEEKIQQTDEKLLYPKLISYTSKQIVSFENAKSNVTDCLKVNGAVFFSIKKAYKDNDLIFLKIKITNKSLKDYSPDDLQISLKDNTEPVNFQFGEFFMNIIKSQTSVDGTIIIRDNRVFDVDQLIVSIRELTNGRDAELHLPINKIELLPILKGR